MKSKKVEPSGLEYAPGIRGKTLFRIRETHVAGPVAEMIQKGRTGAVKLDLVLRGLALLPQHSGKREPGQVLWQGNSLSYSAIHDLCRDPRRFALEAPHEEIDDRSERDKKRTWVGEQMRELERRNLIRREQDERGRRPKLLVLSDLADGSPYDDPGKDTGHRSGYVTVLGSVLTSPAFREWGAREVAGYLCAMTADRLARHRHLKNTGQEIPVGEATWFRQADWFNGQNPNAPRGHGAVVYPFSTSTIERGLRSLRDQGLILARRTITNPETRQHFQSGPRMVYTNRFDSIGKAEVVELSAPRPPATTVHLKLVEPTA